MMGHDEGEVMLPSTLVFGGSGFVGSALLRCRPPHLITRAIQHRHAIEAEVEILQGDLLQPTAPFGTWMRGMDRILMAARPSASTPRARRSMARATSKAMIRFLEALEERHVVAFHGSLSYGDQGDRFVPPSAETDPVGYARSYAIGERPLAHAIPHRAGTDLIRAPWILGTGSWFDLIYATGPVPVHDGGHHWMSIVDVHELATWAWAIEPAERGRILHAPLLARVRQRTFAQIVADVRGVELIHQTSSELRRRHGRQAKDSMIASLRLTDDSGNDPESSESVDALRDAIQSVIAGRS